MGASPPLKPWWSGLRAEIELIEENYATLKNIAAATSFLLLFARIRLCGLILDPGDNFLRFLLKPF